MPQPRTATHSIRSRPCWNTTETPSSIWSASCPTGMTPQAKKRSDEQVVRALTEIGGGLPYFPRNEQEMIADVDGLSRAMQAAYTLAYTTDNPEKDGRERLVEITVDKAHGGAKAIARAPEGFYAPSQ